MIRCDTIRNDTHVYLFNLLKLLYKPYRVLLYNTVVLVGRIRTLNSPQSDPKLNEY